MSANKQHLRGSRPRLRLGSLIVALIAVLLIQFVWMQTRVIDQIPYSEFQTRLVEGRIARVEATLGQLVYDGRQPSVGGMPTPGRERRHADDTAREIDRTAREIVDAACERALSVVRANRVGMDAAAGQLLESETMEEAELREAFGLSQRRAA